MSKRQKPPSPPADLKPLAAQRWTAVVGELARRGPVDLETLRSYCQLWARWREAEDGISTAGQLTKTPAGRIVPSPLVAIANQTAGQVREWEDRLGISTETHEEILQGQAGGGITRRELAARLDVHMMRVTKWEQEGMPIAVRGRKGRASLYREKDVRDWLKAREAGGGGNHNVDVAREKASLTRAQTEEARLRIAIKAGKYRPVEEFEHASAFEAQAISTAVWALPNEAERVARAAALEGIAGVEAALKEIAKTILRELGDANRALPPRLQGSNGEGHAA